jgi:general secretion pathway protein D
MKQLSLMSVPRFSTFVCVVLFGLYQPTIALRQSTSNSSLYGALSSGAREEPTLNFKSIHTLIDTPESIEVLTTRSPEASTEKTETLKSSDSAREAQQELGLKDSSTENTTAQPSEKNKPEGAPTPSALLIPGAPVVIMPTHNDKDELVEFQFEGTDLDNLVKQVALLYDVIFIPDDTISPLPAETKSLKGNKVSFKTHRAMTKGQAWDIFITFLHLSGFALAPDGPLHTYRITTLKNAQHNPLPTYISVDYKDLPDNDQLIRYVYFIENATTDTIKGLLEHFKSPDALVQMLNDSKAFVITDRSYNIKVLINIIKELDKASMPQELLVLKLRQVEAEHVKKLYESLVQSKDEGGYQRFFPPRKTPTSLYFPESVRMIAEKRTNTLIVLGPKDALKVLEDFIVKHVDVGLDQPYSKITTHQLKYADAITIADIMNNVTKLGASTEAGKVGGLRGVDKLVRLSFVAEPDTNTLLIKGDYEDYLLVKPAIEQLDMPQPQVAIEILLLAIESTKTKVLGAQLRTREPALGLVGNNVKFQTQGLPFSYIVDNPAGSGATRLLGDLINLVTDPTSSFGAPGRTVLTLGSDKYGVWGIFRALEKITDAKIISNPFITTSNKTPAKVSIGQTRRVVSSEVIPGGTTPNQVSFMNDSANLTVNITPQINSDGMISLQINIEITDFITPATEIRNVQKVERKLITNAIVANKEILALGGLIQSSSTDASVKVPIIGDIPGLGWLFKDKSKEEGKNTLLVLISTQIINPTSQDEIEKLRKNRTDDISQALNDIDKQLNTQDPIDQTFFNGRSQDPDDRFFTEYIDRKFGVKKYQDILKESLHAKKNKKDSAKKSSKKNKNIKEEQAIQTEQSSRAEPEKPAKEVGV